MKNLTELLNDRISKEKVDAGKQLANAIKMDKAIQHLAHLFPDLDGIAVKDSESGVIIYNKGFTLYFKIPWDSVMMDTLLLRFTKLGWRVSEPSDYRQIHQEIDYILFHPELTKELPLADIRVSMNARIEGSKCKLLQIGTKTTEIPIWDVICEDKNNV